MHQRQAAMGKGALMMLMMMWSSGVYKNHACSRCCGVWQGAHSAQSGLLLLSTFM